MPGTHSASRKRSRPTLRRPRYGGAGRRRRAQGGRATLTDRVKAVERSVDNAKQWAQYKSPATGTDEGTGFNLTTGEWVIRDLIRPNELLPMFQANSEVANSNKFRFTSLKMNIFLSPWNSEISLTPKMINVYLVSLKAATSAQFLDDTGQFNGTLFDNSEGQYWEGTQSINGADVSMPMLSPAVFNIHMHKRMILQNIVEETPDADPDLDTSVHNPNFTHKLIHKTHKMDCLLKTADNKKWKDLETKEVKDTKRLYLLFYQGGFDQAITEGGNGNTISVGLNAIFTGRGTN